ncbi:MAG TPA: glutaredoxin 3 [Bordetella sp.]|nr:glutaredoxin 3 [Bordetella sp.]
MDKVVMYSKDYCPYCARAEALLKQRGVDNLEIIRIDQDPSQRDIMIERTGRRTVPQIFIGDKHIGGCDDLMALDRAGGLAPLLNG